MKGLRLPSRAIRNLFRRAGRVNRSNPLATRWDRRPLRQSKVTTPPVVMFRSGGGHGTLCMWLIQRCTLGWKRNLVRRTSRQPYLALVTHALERLRTRPRPSQSPASRPVDFSAAGSISTEPICLPAPGSTPATTAARVGADPAAIAAPKAHAAAAGHNLPRCRRLHRRCEGPRLRIWLRAVALSGVSCRWRSSRDWAMWVTGVDDGC
jgi:hypothetical protein